MTDPGSLLTRFEFSSLLNQSQAGRRIVLQGRVAGEPALLIAERGAFPTDHPTDLASLPRRLAHVQNLGANDVYHWYLAHCTAAGAGAGAGAGADPPPPDVKLTLVCPATDAHVRKHAFQQARCVVETPAIYARYTRPYMGACRDAGRAQWVANILDGRAERENVLFRSPAREPEHRPADADADADADGFVLLPDLNWDRRTVGGLHLLALVQRRDLWSVRDLKRKHVRWLRHLRRTVAEAVSRHLYPGVEEDMLKFYVHYQPTYYHFHVHVVHVDLDATGTQAVGKALGLDQVISQLENMEGGEEAGMHQVELTYTVGESSELWQQIFLPLKEGRQPTVGNGEAA